MFIQIFCVVVVVLIFLLGLFKICITSLFNAMVRSDVSFDGVSSSVKGAVQQSIASGTQAIATSVATGVKDAYNGAKNDLNNALVSTKPGKAVSAVCDSANAVTSWITEHPFSTIFGTSAVVFVAKSLYNYREEARKSYESKTGTKLSASWANVSTLALDLSAIFGLVAVFLGGTSTLMPALCSRIDSFLRKSLKKEALNEAQSKGDIKFVPQNNVPPPPGSFGHNVTTAALQLKTWRSGCYRAATRIRDAEAIDYKRLLAEKNARIIAEAAANLTEAEPVLQPEYPTEPYPETQFNLDVVGFSVIDAPSWDAWVAHEHCPFYDIKYERIGLSLPAQSSMGPVITGDELELGDPEAPADSSIQIDDPEIAPIPGPTDVKLSVMATYFGDASFVGLVREWAKGVFPETDTATVLMSVVVLLATAIGLGAYILRTDAFKTYLYKKRLQAAQFVGGPSVSAPIQRQLDFAERPLPPHRQKPQSNNLNKVPYTMRDGKRQFRKHAPLPVKPVSDKPAPALHEGKGKTKHGRTGRSLKGLISGKRINKIWRHKTSHDLYFQYDGAAPPKDLSNYIEDTLDYSRGRNEEGFWEIMDAVYGDDYVDRNRDDIADEYLNDLQLYATYEPGDSAYYDRDDDLYDQDAASGRYELDPYGVPLYYTDISDHSREAMGDIRKFIKDKTTSVARQFATCQIPDCKSSAPSQIHEDGFEFCALHRATYEGYVAAMIENNIDKRIPKETVTKKTVPSFMLPKTCAPPPPGVEPVTTNPPSLVPEARLPKVTTMKIMCVTPGCQNMCKQNFNRCFQHKHLCKFTACAAQVVSGRYYCVDHLLPQYAPKVQKESILGSGALKISDLTLVPLYVRTDGKYEFNGHGFFLLGSLFTAAHVHDFDKTKSLFTCNDGKFILLKHKNTDTIRDVSWFTAPAVPGIKHMHWAAPKNLAAAYVARFEDSAIATNVVGIESKRMLLAPGTVADIKAGHEWTHSCDTKFGTSGAPVLNADGRVIGIHTGTTGKKNVFTAFDQVFMMFVQKDATAAGLADVLKQCMHPVRNFHDTFLENQGFTTLDKRNRCQPLCQFSRDTTLNYAQFSLKHMFPLRNNLKLDEDLVAQFKPDLSAYAPAPINHDSCCKATAKYNMNPDVDIDPVAWNKATRWFETLVGPVIDGYKILSHAEYAENYTKNTSPGVCFAGMTKEEFNAKFDAWYDILWEQTSQCSGDCTVSALFMKAELLKRAKVDENKARGFLGAGSFANYIGIRMLKDACDRMHAASHMPFWGGKTPWFGNWDRMYKKFTQFLFTFGTDVKDWDGRYPILFHMFLCLFHYRHLRPEDQTPDNFWRLFNMFYDMAVGYVCLPCGCVFRKPNGMPSGTFFTLDGNSYGNLLNFLYSFAKQYPDADLFDAMKVATMFCGDDNQFACNGEFTFEMFVNGATDFGFEVKLENDNFKDMTFLSTIFAPCPCGCPKKMPSIRPEKLFCAMFYAQNVDPLLQLERLCNIVPMLWPTQKYYVLGEQIIDYLLQKLKLDHCDMRLSKQQVYYLYHGTESRSMGQLQIGFKSNEQVQHTCSAARTTFSLSLRKQFLYAYFSAPSNISRTTYRSLYKSRKAFYRYKARYTHRITRHLHEMSAGSKKSGALNLTVINESKGGPQNPRPRNNGPRPLPPRNTQRNRQRRQRRQARNPAQNQNSMPIMGTGMGGQQRYYPARSNALVRAQQSLNFRSLSPLAANYVMALINPSVNRARIPDVDARKTFLAWSRQVCTIVPSIGATNAGDVGRFSCCLQPKLGRLPAQGVPTQGPTIQLAIQDANSSDDTWTSFNTVRAYNTLIAGTDVRLDSNYATLCGQQPGLWFQTVAATTNPPSPFGGDGVAIPITQAPPTYGLNILHTTTGGVDTFSFPAGSFHITTIINTTAAVADLPPTVTNNMLDFDTIVSQTHPGVGGVQGNFNGQYLVTSDGALFNTISFAWAGAAPASCTGSEFTVTPAMTDAIGSFGNGGLVSQLRPVACAALLTFEGSTLDNGGSISVARVPASVINRDYFSNNPNSAAGNLHNWGPLSKTPGSYNGALKEGGYCWWAPEEVDDLNFYTPEQLNDRDMPGLIFSGQYQAQAGQPVGVIRLMTFVLFECTTDQTLMDLVACEGSTAEYEAAIRALASLPTSCANRSHTELFKRAYAFVSNALKQGAHFYSENKDTINSALSALGKVAVAAAPMFI